MRRRLAERPRDSGIIAVTVFFVLLMILFLAVVINVGRMMQTRADLHHAADSAALAAAESLRGTAAGVTATLTQARAYASRYRLTTGVTVHDATLNPLAAGDVRVGHWHEVAGPCKFDGAGGNCPVGFEFANPMVTGPLGYRLLGINAVQVTTRYTLPSILNYMTATGNLAMRVTSTAVSRGHRVNCALPVAIPSCRPRDAHFATDFLEAGGVLNIPPVPGYKRLVFTSGIENDTTMVPPRNNNWAFGRVDLAGRRDLDWNGTMENFTRTHSLDSMATCLSEGLDTWNYGTQTAATSQLSPQPRIEPLIEALLGITAGGNTTLPSEPCTLGQLHVVPVVDVPGGCGLWPAQSPPALSVIGYVNIVFRRIACSNNSPFFTATGGGGNLNCNDPANSAAMMICTSPVTGTSGHLRVEVEVYGGLPVGPGGGPGTDRQSRLVR